MLKFLLLRFPYRQVCALWNKAQAEYILPIALKPNFSLISSISSMLIQPLHVLNLYPFEMVPASALSMGMYDPHICIIGYHLQNDTTALIHQVDWAVLTLQHRTICLRCDQKGLQSIYLDSLQTEI